MRSAPRNRLIAVLLFLVVSAAAAGVWYWSKHARHADSNIVRIGGTVEAEQTNISVVTAGLIARVNMQDGAPVKKGQVLLQLDASPLAVKLRGANSTLATLDRQRADLVSVLSTIAEKLKAFSAPSKLAMQKMHQFQQVKSKDESGGESFEDAMLDKQLDELHKLEQAQLEGLNEAFVAQQNCLEQACVVEHKAIEEAYSSGKKALAEAKQAASQPCHKIWPLTLIDRQKQKALDEIVKAKDESVEARRKTAIEAVDTGMKASAEALQQGYCTKQKAIKEIFSSKEDSLKTLLAVKQRTNDLSSTVQEKMAAVNAQIERALALPQGLIATAKVAELQRLFFDSKTKLATLDVQIAQALSQRLEVLEKQRDFVVISPIDGICSNANVTAGEVCAPGQTLATLVDANNVYLRGYVPEGIVARVKVGQPALVFLDGQKQPLRAQVTAIDPRASFTPETVVSKESRIQEVFGIRLRIFDPKGLAKPGVPADAEIMVGSAR